MMIPNKLYTVSEIAELLNVTERTVRNYIKQGLLKGKKIGSQWRFTEEDIMKLIDSRKGAAGNSDTDLQQEQTQPTKKAIEHISLPVDFAAEDDDVPVARACMVIDLPAASEAAANAAAERANVMLATVTTDIVPTCDYLWAEESGCIRITLTGSLEQVAKITKAIRKG